MCVHFIGIVYNPVIFYRASVVLQENLWIKSQMPGLKSWNLPQEDFLFFLSKVVHLVWTW